MSSSSHQKKGAKRVMQGTKDQPLNRLMQFHHQSLLQHHGWGDLGNL